MLHGGGGYSRQGRRSSLAPSQIGALHSLLICLACGPTCRYSECQEKSDMAGSPYEDEEDSDEDEEDSEEGGG